MAIYGYVAKGKPWDFQGAKNVEDCNTSQEVMTKAGLDWTVAKCKLVAEMPIIGDNIGNGGFIHGSNVYTECANAFATYRTDYNIPLGIVKDRYTPVQNIEAFKFFNTAIGKNSAIWQTAGYFGNGERIFVSAKLPKNILVNGDPVENYLVFTTSHDGTSGVKILFTPIRVVCQNTLNAAIKGATNYISIRHTATVHNKLDIAHEILGISEKKIECFGQALNEMSKIKFTDDEAQKLFANVVLTESEELSIGNTGHTIQQIIMKDINAINDSGISMKKVNILNEMNAYYFGGIGQKQHLGTGLGVYNAINGYYSNVTNDEGIKRMDSLLYGDKSRKIALSGDLILSKR